MGSAWLARSAEHAILDLRVVSLRPMGVAITLKGVIKNKK